MGFIMVLLANCRRYFKDNKNIVFMFFLPILITCLAYFVGDNESGIYNYKIAVINLDSGTYGNKLVKELKVDKVYENRFEALEDLKNNKYTAVYELPADFSTRTDSKLKPIVNVYKMHNGNSNEEFENRLKSSIKKIMQVNVLEKNNVIKGKKEVEKNIIHISYKETDNSIVGDKIFAVLNIMYLMLIHSTLFAKDLIGLKKGKILERVSSTANHGYQILAGIYISMVVVQSAVSIGSLLVIKLIFKYGFESFAFEALNIILISMISIATAIMASRMSEQFDVGTIIMVLVNLLMVTAYFVGIENKGKFAIVNIIMKFTPFYWAMDSIKNFRIFPNTIILILIALVFFTAGSVKYSIIAKSE